MKRMRNHAFLGAVSALVFLLSSSVQAADPQVEALLANMRNAYRQAKSVTFTTESQIGGQNFVSAFTVVSPAKIRLFVTSPAAKASGILVTKICDGKTIHTKSVVQPTFKDQPFTAERFASDLPVNLESICFFDWEQQLSTAKGKNMEHSTFKITHDEVWNGKKWTVLEETATASKEVCHYYIDPKTFLIWRTITKAMPGGVPANDSDNHITQLNLNAKVDDSIFTIVRV